MIMVCVAIIGLILFFTLDKNHAKYVNEVVESLMLLSMIAASLWFYFSLYSLDVNPHPISFLDDLLLLICLPAFFTFCVLNAISGIGGERWFIPTNVLSVRLSDQRCFHPCTVFQNQLSLGVKFPWDQYPCNQPPFGGQTAFGFNYTGANCCECHFLPCLQYTLAQSNCTHYSSLSGRPDIFSGPGSFKKCQNMGCKKQGHCY